MASVMHRAAYIDDENAPKEKELLSRLVVENKVQKYYYLEMLMIFMFGNTNFLFVLCRVLGKCSNYLVNTVQAVNY